MAEIAKLAVDEQFFLRAMVSLADVEDRGARFELLNVIGVSQARALRLVTFRRAVGREIDREDLHAIEYDVSAVYHARTTPRASIHRAKVLQDFEEPAREAVRTIAWASLQAWALRYGGLYRDLVADRHGTLVDPGKH